MLDWTFEPDASESHLNPYSKYAFGVAVPIPPLLMILGVVTVWRFRAGKRRRKRTRLELELCLDCGYNLTGNVSGVCPECGTPIRPAMDVPSAKSLNQRR